MLGDEKARRLGCLEAERRGKIEGQKVRRRYAGKRGSLNAGRQEGWNIDARYWMLDFRLSFFVFSSLRAFVINSFF